MSWSRYGEAKTLAPTFEFSIACAKAGIPLLVVAPPSGGKSTVIFGAEKFLMEHGEPVRRESRLGLRALKTLTEWLKSSGFATIVNEDFSMIGRTEYMTELMAEIIASLSYMGTYQDEGMKIDVRVTRLGFLSGIQPLWIKTLMDNVAYATHVREKFMRYYDLPYTPSPSMPMLEAIDLLSKKTDFHDPNIKIRIPSEFLNALSFQVGSERAKEYAPRICRELSRIMPHNRVHNALKFYAERIGFERDFLTREITDEGFNIETRWHGYHALYWCLRKGKVTREEFMNLLGVTSLRSVDRAVEYGIRFGWVTSEWNSDKKVFMATNGMIKRCALP